MAESSRKNRCLKCTGHAGFDVYKTDLSHQFKCPRADCDCADFCWKAMQASKRVRKAQTGAKKSTITHTSYVNANVSNEIEHEGVDEFRYDAELELGDVFYHFVKS